MGGHEARGMQSRLTTHPPVKLFEVSRTAAFRFLFHVFQDENVLTAAASVGMSHS